MPQLDLCDMLRLARTASRGKRASQDVAAFLLDVEVGAIRLADELRDGTWSPGMPRAFWIHEPKRRLISALPFRDRIVQHALVEATLPALERSFAPQSYACRRGFGTHRCLRAATRLTRRHAWVLRLDIAKFFHSIDHAVLLGLLRSRTPPAWWPLTQRIVAAPAHVEVTRHYFSGDDLFTPLLRPRGLPVGNLTSQIWANLVLTPVDHLLASYLRIGTFVRYCDDLLVFHNDAGVLRAAADAVEARCDKLRLRLHPHKCRLHRTTEPVAFLGFVLQRTGQAVTVRLRGENVRRFRQRMRDVRALYEVGAVHAEEVTSRVQAWLAHARHGHTRELCRRELGRLSFGARAEVEEKSPGAGR